LTITISRSLVGWASKLAIPLARSANNLARLNCAFAFSIRLLTGRARPGAEPFKLATFPWVKSEATVRAADAEVTVDLTSGLTIALRLTDLRPLAEALPPARFFVRILLVGDPFVETFT